MFFHCLGSNLFPLFKDKEKLQSVPVVLWLVFLWHIKTLYRVGSFFLKSVYIYISWTLTVVIIVSCFENSPHFKVLGHSPGFLLLHQPLTTIVHCLVHRLYTITQSQPVPMKGHCRWKQLIWRDDTSWQRWDHMLSQWGSQCGFSHGWQTSSTERTASTMKSPVDPGLR